MIEWKFPQTLLEILATIVIAVIVRVVIVIFIKRATKRAAKKAKARKDKDSASNPRLLDFITPEMSERHQQRTAALASLFRSVTTFSVVTITLATIIWILGIPLGPLLTATGIGGVALGIGAQSLVKDFLAGISIIIEDQYGVGDIVSIGDISGVVEDISLRSTRVRDTAGQIWYISNGEIFKVGNISQGWSTANVEIPMDPNIDSAQAAGILTQVAAQLNANPDFSKILLASPTVEGVNSVTSQTMTILMKARTAPNKHLIVERELLARGVEALREAGIGGPIMPLVVDSSQPPQETTSA